MAEKRFYNANDGVTGRDGGPYLDQIQADAAESLRAKREGREPNEGYQVHAGTQLVSEAELLQRGQAVNIPSMEDAASDLSVEGFKETLAEPAFVIDVPDAAKFTAGEWMGDRHKHDETEVQGFSAPPLFDDEV